VKFDRAFETFPTRLVRQWKEQVHVVEVETEGYAYKGARYKNLSAIYTRKSSEEGLEQSFNSLDAQREACQAFIASQRHEGWRAVPAEYDDGGYSGGTLDRPALQRLLEDVEARKVDTIVVYKVDRLTRSLADFAKIVEALDTRGVSFVSVTQQFNTTTSMGGRLTLNILLSFAQFERISGQYAFVPCACACQVLSIVTEPGATRPAIASASNRSPVRELWPKSSV
jgi:hypothetical protein